MTISSQNRKSGPFLGTGSVSEYPFNFTVFEAADVVVTRTDLADVETVLTSGYTVTLNADQNASPGGTVVLAAPLASGFKLTLTSEIAATQEVDLTNQGGFYPKVVSLALDKLTIIVQQLAEKVSRAVVTPISSGTSGADYLDDLIDVIGGQAASAATAQVNANLLDYDARLDGLEGSAQFLNYRGDWVTATAYVYTPGVRRDMFRDPLTGDAYVVLASHTSTSIAADVSSGLIAANDISQLRVDLAASGSGFGTDLVTNRRTDLAGAVGSSLAAHIRRSEINIARDFNLSPGADITAAMLAVLDDGRGWYLPGTPLGAGNDWLVSADLPVTRSDNKGRGDGRSYTRVRATHANGNIFTWGSGPYVLMHLADMRLTSIGTGSPLYFPYDAGKLLYGSAFENLHCIAVDGNGMHLGSEFQTAIRSCWSQSDTMHAFFLQGGNTTIVDNCYAIKCGNDKAGYRSLSGGQFNSCNGINSGGSNFWFGSSSVAGPWGAGGADANDPFTGSTIAWAQLINCNMEYFQRYGIKTEFQSYIEVIGGKFAPREDTGYAALIDLGGTSLCTLQNRPRVDYGSAVRVAYPADGLASAVAADYNRRGAAGKFFTNNETGRMMALGTATPTPMPSNVSDVSVYSSLSIQGSTTPGASVTSSAVRVKIDGDSCRIWGRVILTTKDVAMAGNIRIVNLPYAPNASVGVCGIGVIGRANLVTPSGGNTSFSCEINSGTNYIKVIQTGNGSTAAEVPVANMAQGGEFAFDITYLVQ